MKGYDGVIDSKKAQEITEKYYTDVYSYCYSLVNSDTHEAEVLTQDVFVLFYEKCNELDDTYILRWLLVVAKNKAKEFYRQKKKDSALVSLDESFLEIDDNDIQKMFEENFTDNDIDIDKYISILLKALNKKERELYYKIFQEKKPYKEIAAEMNITEAALSSRAIRLKKKIRTIIKLMFSSVGQFIIKIFF